jgi:hypothetical protein
MKDRLENKNPFVEMARSQREEIDKYRWIESERVGYDIGWKQASEEWMQKHFAGWKRSLRERGVQSPAFEMLWFQQQEIESYKWIESERIGRDIGWKRAVTEWHDRHYGKWREHVTRISVDDQEGTDATPTHVVSKPIIGKRKRNFSVEHRESIATSMRAWHDKKKSGGTCVV